MRVWLETVKMQRLVLQHRTLSTQARSGLIKFGGRRKAALAGANHEPVAKSKDDDDVIVMDGSELEDDKTLKADQKATQLTQLNSTSNGHRKVTRSMVRQRRPMEAPAELVEGLKKILLPHSLRRLASDYEKLAKETAEFETGKSIKVPSYDSRRAVAYLAFRTIPAFGVIKAALQRAIEAGFRLPSQGNSNEDDDDDNTVLALDFGSGPGTATWAAWDAFEMKTEGRRLEATFVESSLPMIDAAVQLSEGAFQANWCRNILELARSVSKEGAARFDLVLATFALGDLPSDEARQVALDLLWESVAANGLLLVVERGTARGAHIVGKARKQILAGGSRFDTARLRRGKRSRGDENDGDGEAEENRNSIASDARAKSEHFPKAIAPCGHERPCPLLAIAESYGSDLDLKRMKKHEFCHFVQCTSRLLKATTDDNSVPLRMNYSYVAIQKCVKDVVSRAESNPPQLRVLSKPKRNIRHVVLNLCDPQEEDGLRKQVIAHSNREMYRPARKLEWGDLLLDNLAKKDRDLLNVTEDLLGDWDEDDEDEDDDDDDDDDDEDDDDDDEEEDGDSNSDSNEGGRTHPSPRGRSR